jgi:hypothetical protein
MAISLHTLKDDRLHHAISSFRNMFGSAPVVAPVANEDSDSARSPEAQALFDVKKNLLEQVRGNLPEGERPTLEHYRLAAEQFAQTDKGAAMAARGEWNNKIAADLSEQDLSGFTITEPKKAALETHHLEAQHQQKHEEWARTIATDTVDIHDRDGDGQINSAPVHLFYDNVRFDKADLHGAWVEPATSFNEEIAKAGNLQDLTFSGMHEGDEFTFGAGKYENATLRDVQGGKVIFGENTQVNGVVLEGRSAHIEMHDNSYVSNVRPDEHFRILDLQMGKNSVLAHSDLGESTIAMTSHFEPGATFQHVNLSGNLEGLDFTGLKLHNVTIDGRPITHASQLAEHGITHDHTTIALSSVKREQEQALVASAEQAPQHAQEAAAEAAPKSELARIRDTMQGAIASIGSKTPEAEAPVITTTKSVTPQMATADPHDSFATMASASEAASVSQQNNAIAAAGMVALASGIKGGESVDTKDIALTHQVASQERTVPVEHQATVANMDRSGGSQA